MKWFLGLFACCCLVACKENETARPASSPRPALISKDSGLLTRDSINPYAPVDLSPLDMSYFPEDYPQHKLSGTLDQEPVMRVTYSRPHRQGRRIFGALLKYGEPWRLGANEASEIEFFRAVTVQGKTIPKGRYIIYCIPRPDQWTVVLNTNLYSWGLHLDTSKDVFRFNVPIQIVREPIEFFSMVFHATAAGAELVMAWDTVVARLPIQTR